MADPRKTPLDATHRELGAKMVPSGGWDMPLEYSGLIAEHLAVRRAAGLSDLSHMGEIEVRGPGALAFLQRVTSNDVARLADGQAQLSALPLPNGAPVDEVVVLRHGPERFLLVVSASHAGQDLRWLSSQDPRGCDVADVSDQLALLALQGPRAEAILQPLVPAALPGLGPWWFAETLLEGIPVTVCRAGSTGEDGFEILLAPERAEAAWKRLLEAGKEAGLLPAGLGAGDTLRLEARLVLHGSDVDETTTLVEAGLEGIVSLDPGKGDFNGRPVLEGQKKHGVARRLVGFEMTGRGIARQGCPVWVDQHPAGHVTSGSYAPFLGKNIGLCYLPAAKTAVGTPLEIEVRGRRVGAKVVPTPFYERPASSTT